VKTYPVFLIGLENRRCVVLGGGSEAERKIEGLLDAGAAVTVVAAAITPQIEAHVQAGRLRWLARRYRPGDLEGAFLAFATGMTRSDNERAWREAQKAGALINAVDDVPHCSFICGSIVRRGDLVVAISTGGTAPALAVRLREALERQFGDEYGDFLALLAELRARLAERVPDSAERRALWYELVDSGALADLRDGVPKRARKRLETLVRAHGTARALPTASPILSSAGPGRSHR
jgi:siroheme synthase-like protein